MYLGKTSFAAPRGAPIGTIIVPEESPVEVIKTLAEYRSQKMCAALLCFGFAASTAEVSHSELLLATSA